jgi:peroxiredoxin
MERQELSSKFVLGSKLPEFYLPSVAHGSIDSKELNGKAILIVFMCNHCPYVVGSIKMLNETIRKYLDQGLQAVGINSNDPEKYPQDSFENMKQFAQTHDLCFPYCFDETQEVAKAFDAACTPELYLFDSNKCLIYHGGINDYPDNPDLVTKNFLDEVCRAYFSGENIDSSWSLKNRPRGCSIKWK